MKRLFPCTLLLCMAGAIHVHAQNPPAPTTPPNGGPTPMMGMPGGSGRSTAPKPYAEVITAKAKTDRGLLTTHKVEDKYFFEIPDSVLGREILVVNRISKAAAGARAGFTGYAGDQISDNVIAFEKGPNNRIFMKSISYQESASDSLGMYQSVRNSNLQPIVASFDVKAYGQDSVTKTKSSVIEMTDYIQGDNEILFFDSRVKRALGLSSYQSNNSYVADVRSYPSNVQIKTVKTYMRTPPSINLFGGAPSPATPFSMATGSPTTYELNSSMILLPRKPMQPRLFDPRVGYFATSVTDFDANPQGVERISMVTRWRLEPKPEDVEKYKRGELVEPQKPIVFYIDPATPRKWVPYLMQGVNDWQVAFEKAGFKNAIMAKEAPKNDPEWSIENANYSAIVYKPSDIPNASGPHVHDPRSGEILESHINWYHNVMNLLRNWYFTQTAAVDPRARNPQFNDSLMGQLIRFVSSHEVGHTLGLRHNFGSSSTVPVEKLRDKKWVEANGHTPSIMDYARFNYVAQPEDNISEVGLFPRIGDYDKWAIEWGYRWHPEAKSAEAERPILNKITIDKLKDKRLWFITEIDPDDPRAQSEDLSDNSIKASEYGIKNLKRIINELPTWSREANRGYSTLDELYSNVLGQFSRYMGHVSKNIGGIQTTPKTVEQAGMIVEYTAKERQQEAMRFLQEQLFTTPRWLVKPQITGLTADNPLTMISQLQENTLNRLVSTTTLNKLLRAEAEAANPYSAAQMMTDLQRGIWSELNNRSAIDIYRRNLQKTYVERLISLVNPSSAPNVMMISFGPAFGMSNPKTSDAMSIAKMSLRNLQQAIRTALPSAKDAMTRAHLQDVNDRITQALDPK